MMKVRFDRNTCTGCFACYVACIAEHHGPEEADARGFRRVEKVTDPAAGFQKNVCPGCIHCGKCIKVCPSGALYREETYGLVLADKEKCTGCRACESVCPMQVIRFDEDGKAEKCDGCISRIKEGRKPVCESVCCTGAIRMEER